MTDACPPGYTFGANKCYKMSVDKKDFDKASEACKVNGLLLALQIVNLKCMVVVI